MNCLECLELSAYFALFDVVNDVSIDLWPVHCTLTINYTFTIPWWLLWRSARVLSYSSGGIYTLFSLTSRPFSVEGSSSLITQKVSGDSQDSVWSFRPSMKGQFVEGIVEGVMFYCSSDYLVWILIIQRTCKGSSIFLNGCWKWWDKSVFIMMNTHKKHLLHWVWKR